MSIIPKPGKKYVQLKNINPKHKKILLIYIAFTKNGCIHDAKMYNNKIIKIKYDGKHKLNYISNKFLTMHEKKIK